MRIQCGKIPGASGAAVRGAAFAFAALFALAPSATARAVVIPSFCESAMRRALDADADWTMTRTLPNATRALVTTGAVSCAAMRGIIWDVRHPFPERITMTTNEMVFADEDGRRVKPLSELPHYERLRRETDAFVAGDPKAFEGVLDVETRIAPDGEWTLVFTPAAKPLRRLLESVEVTGRDTVTRAVLRTSDGGVSTIDFRETARSAHSLWPVW